MITRYFSFLVIFCFAVTDLYAESGKIAEPILTALDAITDLCKTPTEYSFCQTIVQIPSYQYYALKDKPSYQKRHSAMPPATEWSTKSVDCIRIAQRGDIMCYHRIRASTHDGGLKIGLNVAVAMDGTTCLQRTYSQKTPIDAIARGELKLIMETTVPNQSLRLPNSEQPLKHIEDYMIALTHGEVKSSKMTGTSAEMEIAIDDRTHHLKFNKLNDQFFLSTDETFYKETAHRSTLSVSYCSDAERLDGMLWPKRIEIANEYLIDGQYRPYISFCFEVHSVSKAPNDLSLNSSVLLNKEDIRELQN